MPYRFTLSEVVCLLTTAVGTAATVVGVVGPSDSMQRIGIACLLMGVLPLVLKAVVHERLHHARAEIDSYRDEQIAAGKQEIDSYRAQIEGAAFANAIELWRSGELTQTGSTTGAAIHTLTPKAS